MKRRCSICNRRTEGDPLCPYHQRAYLNLRGRYKRWREAMEIGWEDYLKVVAENPNTGEWAREVAQHLLNDGDPSKPSPPS